MCFRTNKFPEQASDLVLVQRMNQILGIEKERLYIGLYVRGDSYRMPGGEDEYHWAFLAGPKKHPKSGSRHIMYHAKDSLVVACRPPGIRSERAYVKDSDRAAMLLVRLVIGKIADHQRLEKILKEVPLRPDDANWNCVVWMANAFEKVVTDGRALSSSVKEWGSVRDKAMWYVDYKKKTHRFDGKETSILFDPHRPATWDMLGNRELTP